MNGIDISSFQTGIDLSVVPCDFVIVKATQGLKYKNPDYDRAVKQAKSLGKLLGVYHYASCGGAAKEAEHFIDVVKGEIGSAILVLDWESGSNVNFNNRDYAKQFLDQVYAETGVKPFIYMSKSVCRQFNWNDTAPIYPLWVAQYANMSKTGYKENPWTDKYSFGAWNHPSIFQYSSKGLLTGWSGDLDLDKSYITKEAWKEAASVEKGTPSATYSVDDYQLKNVSYGDQSEYVRFMQTLLNSKGYDCGEADGVFGIMTSRALGRFMAEKHLVSCTENVWEELVK